MTIGVLTYNQQTLVNALAEELSPYLLVIDAASEPPIKPPTKTPYTVMRMPENRYFAGGWNWAMPRIGAEWVAMLNDDISGISLEMIDSLVATAERNGYTAISPAFNSPHRWSQADGGGLRIVPAIDWVATIVRRDAFLSVGGFDSENFPGYGCDLDIAYRFKQAGYRMATDSTHVIHHMGGTAAITAGTQGIQGNVTSMNDAFQRKYGVPDWAQFVTRYLL